jgi:hypothetical protein
MAPIVAKTNAFIERRIKTIISARMFFFPTPHLSPIEIINPPNAIGCTDHYEK